MEASLINIDIKQQISNPDIVEKTEHSLTVARLPGRSRYQFGWEFSGGDDNHFYDYYDYYDQYDHYDHYDHYDYYDYFDYYDYYDFILLSLL